MEARHAKYFLFFYAAVGALGGLLRQTPGRATLSIQVLIAICGVFVGYQLLKGAIAEGASSLRGLVVVYLYVAILFGSAYFILFVSNPKTFSIDEDIQDAAIVQHLKAKKEQLKGTLKQVEALDRALATMVKADPEAVAANALNRSKGFTYEGSDGERWLLQAETSFYYGGAYGQSEHRHKLNVWSLLPTGETTEKPFVEAPLVKQPQGTPNEIVSQLLTGCAAMRSNLIDDLDLNYYSKDAMRTQFTPVDFVYFAIMAPGSDIIKPATWWMRLIILGQFLTVTGLAFRQIVSSRG